MMESAKSSWTKVDAYLKNKQLPVVPTDCTKELKPNASAGIKYASIATKEMSCV